MRKFIFSLASVAIILTACATKKKAAKRVDHGPELMSLSEKIVGMIKAEKGAKLLYYNLDSAYHLSAFVQAGFEVEILGTYDRYLAMQNEPYWPSVDLPFVELNSYGLKTEAGYNMVFLDRPSPPLSSSELEKMLLDALSGLPKGGKLVLILPKSEKVQLLSHYHTVTRQFETRNPVIDTTFSTNFHALIFSN